jgi:hypothetical protein
MWNDLIFGWIQYNHKDAKGRKEPPAGNVSCGRVLTFGNGCDSSRQKRPDFRQHFLKAFAWAAGAGVVSAELFEKLLVTMHDAVAGLDVRFGRIALAAFAHDLKSSGPRNGCVRVAYEAPFVWAEGYSLQRDVQESHLTVTFTIVTGW